MKRALAVLALLSFTGCESAAKHPAITIGAVTGTMSFGLCELSVGDLGKCGQVGAAVALGLGGLTALVTLLANTNAEKPVPDGQDPNAPREDVTEPPPGLPVWMLNDAGVPPPLTQTDGSVAAPLVDAAVADGM